jgi:hypothetical protein
VRDNLFIILVLVFVSACDSQIGVEDNISGRGANNCSDPEVAVENFSSDLVETAGSLEQVIGALSNINLDNLFGSPVLVKSSKQKMSDYEKAEAKNSIIENLNFQEVVDNEFFFKIKEDCSIDDKACSELIEKISISYHCVNKTIALNWDSVKLCELSKVGKNISMNCSLTSTMANSFAKDVLALAIEQNKEDSTFQLISSIISAEFNVLNLSLETNGSNTLISLSAPGSFSIMADGTSISLNDLRASIKSEASSLEAAIEFSTAEVNYPIEEGISVNAKMLQTSSLSIKTVEGIMSEVKIKLPSNSAKIILNGEETSFVNSLTIPELSFENRNDGILLTKSGIGPIGLDTSAVEDLGPSIVASVAISSYLIDREQLYNGVLAAVSGSIDVDYSLNSGEETGTYTLDSINTYTFSSLFGAEAEKVAATDDVKGGEVVVNTLPESCNPILRTTFYDSNDNVIKIIEDFKDNVSVSSDFTPGSLTSNMRMVSELVNTENCPTADLNLMSYKGELHCNGNLESVDFSINSIIGYSSSDLSISLPKLPGECDSSYVLKIVNSNTFSNYENTFYTMGTIKF